MIIISFCLYINKSYIKFKFLLSFFLYKTNYIYIDIIKMNQDNNIIKNKVGRPSRGSVPMSSTEKIIAIQTSKKIWRENNRDYANIYNSQRYYDDIEKTHKLAVIANKKYNDKIRNLKNTLIS
jgi:hypothetical protein